MNRKQDIRKEMGARRRALEPRWIESASAQIIRRLEQLEVFRSAGSVALYMAVKGEVDLDPLLPVCWKQGMRTCIPVFNRSAGLYELTEITPDTRFSKGHCGIREPECRIPCSIRELDLAIVPGVAFDQSGNRLGRGGGYYDRLLDGFTGLTAGVAFDFQVLPSVPVHQHDRPVSTIVTEKRIINVL